MTHLSKIALAAAAVVAFGSAAQAADAILPIPAAPVVVPPSAAFDWSGFYAGVNVGGLNDIDDDLTSLTLGGQIGANAVFDFFVLGAELGLDAVIGDPDIFSYGDIVVRAGAVVADPLLVYAAVGVGTDFDMPQPEGVGSHILAGAGAEFAVTDSVSVDARYMYGWELDGANSDIHQFGVGVNFHF